MPTVRPFKGYLVAPERVHDVVAPAYDALTPAQRHSYAEEHPESYVNAMRSLDEFTESGRPALEELLERNKKKLEDLIARQAFLKTNTPCLFIYRLKTDDHEQVGLVGEIPIDEYDRGIVKKHEHTQTNLEDRLVRYNDIVGASSSPVCLTYAHHLQVDAIVDEYMQTSPLIDFVAEDGVAQSIWCIDDPDVHKRLQQYFAEVGEAYLTDGHHRAAAASRFAQLRKERNSDHTGEEAYNYLLVALFPDDQIRILAYNRYVKDLNGLSAGEFLEILSKDFTVECLGGLSPEQAAPSRPREFSMLLADMWYRLKVDPETVPEDDPVGTLDITVLHERIFNPVLGVADLRTDERCDSIAGALGMEGLTERCGEEDGVAFACHPMLIHQLMAVADANLVMPPKSTWFDPKVRSGLFLRLR
ncbi:MAG: hypothetical protein MAG794_01076 [Gammaproteobacteria bacterium]|nr:hypothetical protein [Gammaproteobacteria bacterium]